MRNIPLTTAEAAMHLGVQPCTLEAWRSRGAGPRYLKLGRAVRYRVTDLDQWLDARIRNSTSDDERVEGAA